MNHSFNVDIAKEYGIPCAVILEYFKYWISKNEADGRNFYGGAFWTFSSLRELTERFPYLNKDQIWRTIAKLKAEGLIVTGNFNKRPFDRTLWYTLTDKGWKLFRESNSHFAPVQNGVCENATSTSQYHEMDDAPVQNGVCENATPIPVNIPNYINPVIDTIINQEEQRAREGDTVDPNWTRFTEAYQRNLGAFEYDKPMVLEELTSLYESMGVDVMLEAIRVTVLKHTDNPRQYFMKLCRRWDEKGIDTLEKAKAAQREHERGQNGGMNRGEHRGHFQEDAPKRLAGETIV